MKKIILLAGLLITGFAQAQIVTITGNGQEITEGQTFTFNTITPQSSSELDLVVTNISANPIRVKLRMNTIVNNVDGDGMNFCFGDYCYNEVEPGDTVPPQVGGKLLPPGGNNGNSDHFWNSQPGDNESAPVTYNMSFVEVNAAGEILQVLRTFNYVYSPTMGTNEFASLESLGINVNNTIVKDVLKLNASQKATVEFYSVSGQLVKSATVTEGSQSLDLSGLSAAVYIAKFTTENNQSSSIRIVKN